MQPTLVILAAGMASRYGSMKQVEGFGPGGETIMDYSIFDAIRAGFGKVVFIIRRDFETEFNSLIGPRLKDRIPYELVFQEMENYMDGFSVPPERTKPWGTAHAVLCAGTAVHEPFAVINADDFYGLDAFQKANEFLVKECNEKCYSIIGYELAKTLSEHGSVSRGVCQVDKKNFLVAINERTKIYRENGKITYEEKDEKHELSDDTKVSMNFWCFDPSVFRISEKLFHQFLEKNISNPKAEFFIPIVGDEFIRSGMGEIKVIPTSAQWFGVTYREDAPGVKKSLEDLVNSGAYPPKLWTN